MPNQATSAKPRPRRRLIVLGLIALSLWVVGIVLFLLTNHGVVPYLQYQLASHVPLFATPTPTALPTATAAPTSTPCTPTPTQPCAAPTATPGAGVGIMFSPLPSLALGDVVGFTASMISIVGAIPPTARFFMYVGRSMRRRSRKSSQAT